MTKFSLIQRIYAQSLKDILPGANPGDPAKAELVDVEKFIIKVINIAVYAASIVAAIMILESAFQYITSYGDDNKAASAKKTLIWALVGLVVVALAKLFIYNIQKIFGGALAV